MKVVLSIAGSDSSGGAGIQADLKTMTAHGVYGMTAITALTAQNTTGVSSIVNSTPEFLDAQIEVCLSDIPADTIERIEIVKGGGSVLYGSSALAGVINIITKTTA